MRERTPAALWYQANGEHPSDPEARRVRYHELMVEEGHIVCSTCGLTRDDSEALSCSSGFHRRTTSSRETGS